eukprot:COSAG02_NODE_571_length_20173_cov_14.694032_5_plen_78_part_00
MWCGALHQTKSKEITFNIVVAICSNTRQSKSIDWLELRSSFPCGGRDSIVYIVCTAVARGKAVACNILDSLSLLWLS